jgi:hypothetical protein
MPEYKLVVDCTTGKQEYLELTAAEIAQRDQDAAKFAEERAKREAEAEALAALKESAKAKLTAGEPLTDEEASAIVI